MSPALRTILLAGLLLAAPGGGALAAPEVEGETIEVATGGTPAAGAGGKPCLAVERIVVAGVTLLPAEAVRAAVAPHAVGCVGDEAAGAVVGAVNEVYAGAGYVTTQAYLPPQDLRAARILRIEIVAGRVGRIDYRETDADGTLAQAWDDLRAATGFWDGAKKASALLATLDNDLDRFQLIPPEAGGGLKARLVLPLDPGDVVQLDRLQQGIDGLNRAPSQKAALGAVASTGDIIASGRLALTAAGYAATSDKARMGGDTVVIRLGGGDLSNLGQIVAAAGLDLQAGTLANGATGRIGGAAVGLVLTGTADNRGAIEATGDLALTATALTNAGTVVADGAGSLTLTGALGNAGKLVAQTLTAGIGGDLGNTGLITAKGPGALALTVAGRVDNGGSLLAQAGDLTLTAGGIVASTGDIIASGRLALTAAGYVATSDGARMGGDAVAVRLGRGDLSNIGQIVAAAGLDVQAGTLANGASGRIGGAAVGLALTGAASNEGAIEATGDLTLTATGLANAGTVVASGAGTITLSGALSNGGKLVGGTLTVGVGGDLGNTGVIAAKGPGALTLTVAGRVDNAGGLLAQAGDLTVTAGGVVASTGDIIASGGLTLTASGYAATSDGARMGGDAVVIRLGQGDLSNLGLIAAAAGLDVRAGTLENGASGRIGGAGVGLALTGAATNGGRIESRADLTLTATGLTNAGTTVAEASAALTLAGGVDNTGHLVAKGGNLTLTAGGAVASTGDIIAKGHLALTAASYAATSDAARMGGGDIVVRLGRGDLSNLGQIAATAGLDAQAGTLENGASGRISGATLALALTGAADNEGLIESTGGLTLTATGLTNAGTVVADGAGTITLTGALANSGNLVGGTLTVGVGGDLGNTGGIAAKGPGALTLTVAGRVDNGGSLLAQAGDLTLTAGGVVASTGDIIASGGLTLTAGGYAATSDRARMGGNAVVIRLGGGDLSNLGQIVATAGLDAQAGTLSNGTSGHISGAALGLALTGAADNRGTIESTGDLTLTAASLANAGTVVVDGTGAITLTGGLGNTGKLVGGTLTAGVGGDLGNNGLIGAKGPGALTLTVTGRVDNGGSLLAQAGDLSLTAGGAVASTGDIIAKGHLALTAASYAATSDAARMGGGDIVVRLGRGDLSNLGQIAATAGLDAQAGTLENGASGRISGATLALALTGAADTKGLIESTGALTLTAASLANAGTVVADGTGTITLTGALSNGGSLVGGTLTIGVGTDLANTGAIAAKGPGALTLTAGGRVDNGGSLLTQAGDLTLTAGGAVASTGDIIAKGHLALTAASYAATSDAARMGGGDIVVHLGGGDLSNLGQIVATAGLDVQAGSLENGDKARIAGATVGLALTGAADTKGLIESTGALTLTAASLANTGTVVADGAGTITLTGALSNGGKLVGQTLTVGTGGDLGNAGLIAAADTLTLSVAGRADNAGHLIAKGGDLTFTAGGIVASSGDIVAGGALTLTAAEYDATSEGSRTGGNTIVVRLGAGKLSNLGQVVAATSLDVQAGTLDNGATGRLAGAGVGLTLKGAADNKGMIEATADLTLNATGLANAGAIVANGAGTLTLTGDFTNGGRVEFSRDGSVTAASYGGLAASRLRARNLTLAIGAGLSNAGEISAGGLLDVKAGSLGNGAAGLLTGNATKLVIGGDLGNAGTISAVDFLSVTVGGALGNQGAITGMDLLLGVGGGIRNEGRIAAVGTLTATGASLDNLATGAISGNSAGLTLTGAVANAGAISATDALVIKGASLANAGTATATATLSAARLTLEVAGNLGNGPYAAIAGSALASIKAATTDLDYYGVNDVAHGQFTFGGDLGLTLTAKGLTVDKGQSLKAEHGALAISTSGDIEVAGTIASQGDLTLISGGSIAVGRMKAVTLPPTLGIWYGSAAVTFMSLENGEVFTQGNGRIEAAGDLTNTASTIQASGSLAIKVGGTLTNTRMAQTESSVGARNPSAHIGASAEKYTDYLTQVRESSDAGQIVAGGDLSVQASKVVNDASVITAGGVLTLEAAKIENSNRSTGTKYVTIKTGGDTNIGIEFGRGTENSGRTIALLEGDGGVNIKATKVEGDGTITGPTVTINASIVVNGPSGGSVTGPAARLTNGTIDLVGSADGGSLGSSDTLGAAGTGTGPAGQRVDASAGGGSLAGGALNDQAGGGRLTPSGVGAAGATAGALTSNDGAGAPGRLAGGAIGTNATGSRLAGPSDATSAGRHRLTGGTVAGSASGGRLDAGGGSGEAPLDGGTVSASATGSRLTVSGGTAGAGSLTGAAVFASATGGEFGAGSVPSPNAAGFPRPVGAADSTAHAAGITAPPSGTRAASASGIVYLHRAPLAGATERGPDWILDQVGDARTRQGLTVFADPTTEEGLIRQALVAKIGRALLDPSYTNPERQREALYQGTVDYLKAHPEIHLGDRLSDARKAALTAPMLWYESRVIDGRSTLVPVLLLPEGDLGRYSQAAGGGIVGGDVFIKADQVTNAGTILATGTLTINAGTLTNEQLVDGSGRLQAGGVLGGTHVTLVTTGDFTDLGGSITATRDLSLTVGGNILIAAQAVTTTLAGGKNTWFSTTTTTNVGALVSAGGTLTMHADGALAIAGSTVTAGGDAWLSAGGPVSITAGTDTTSTTSLSKKDGWFSSKTTWANQTDATVHPAEIAAGGALTITSGADMTVTASHLSAGGDLGLTAAGDVALLNGQDRHSATVATRKSGLGLGALVGVGGGLDLYATKRTAGTAESTANVATTLTAGGNATVSAGRDLALVGSSVTAGKIATVSAGRDLTVEPGQDTAAASLTRTTSGFGLTGSVGDGGASASLGYHGKTTRLAVDTATAVASTVSGGTGLVVSAGRDARLTGADLASGGDATVTAGRDLTLDAASDTTRTEASRSRTTVGLTAQVGQNVTGALDQLKGAAGTAASGQGGDGYRAIGAASGAMQAIDGALALTHPAVTASLTLGAARSGDHRTGETQAARPTTIRAAGDVRLTAGQDAHLEGTQAQAGGRMDVSAGGDLTVESAQSRSASAQSSASWSAGAGIGVSVGVGAPSSAGITARGAVAQARGRDDGTANLNAHLTAGTGLSLSSGADTVVAGAVVSAPEVAVKAGGDLSVASRQDTDVGRSTSRHLSGSVTVGVGGGPSSGSLSVGGGRSSRDRAWVGEQTAIRSDGALDVTAGGHTQVDGAVIASKTGRLTLDNGTLTVTDLKDRDRSSSTDLTVGGSFTTGGGDKGGDGPSQIQGQGQPVTTPEGRPVGGTLSGRIANADREGVSRGTLGAGTITIHDPAHQGQDVAGINRDVGQAQQVTKDERSGVSFYASDAAIREAAGGLQRIQQGAGQIGQAARDGFKDLPAQVQATVKDVAVQVGLAGRTAENAINAMIDALVVRGAIPEAQAEAASDLAKRALQDDDTYKRLKTNGSCGKQGFNLHEILFTTAHAQGATVAGCVATTIVVAPEVALAALAVAGIIAVGTIVYNAVGKDDAGPRPGGRNSDPNNPDETLGETTRGKSGEPPSDPGTGGPNIDPTALSVVAAAATASKFELSDNRSVKIFGDRDGHIADTPSNRSLLLDVASDPTAALGQDIYGNSWSARNLPDGTQVWTQTRNGQLWNGGINKTPQNFDPKTGLASPTRPGWKLWITHY